MNWGHKITIVIFIFIIAMLSMVFVAFKQTNEMVDANYYDKEIKYQSLIDAAHNLNAVSNDALITQNAEGILVSLPSTLVTDFENGTIEFLRSDNQKKDVTISFTPSPDGTYLISPSIVSPGTYKVRTRWDNAGKNYYREQDIIIGE